MSNLASPNPQLLLLLDQIFENVPYVVDCHIHLTFITMKAEAQLKASLPGKEGLAIQFTRVNILRLRILPIKSCT